MCSLTPYDSNWGPVSTQLSLDGRDGVIINLNNPVHVPSAALWGISGLANTQHTLVASRAPDGLYVVVDAFMYVCLFYTYI